MTPASPIGDFLYYPPLKLWRKTDKVYQRCKVTSNHYLLFLKEQIKLDPVKMIAEIPKNSHIYIISLDSRTLHSYEAGLAIVSLVDRNCQ